MASVKEDSLHNKADNLMLPSYDRAKKKKKTL